MHLSRGVIFVLIIIIIFCYCYYLFILFCLFTSRGYNTNIDVNNTVLENFGYCLVISHFLDNRFQPALVTDYHMPVISIGFSCLCLTLLGIRIMFHYVCIYVCVCVCVYMLKSKQQH